jgi:hypothetical protein
MQIPGRWQDRFGQVFSDLRARSTTFESLHLRAFAFLSSNGLTRGLPPHPPRPLLPEPKPWGRGGAERFGGERIRIAFRRVGEAGFTAQPTIERGIGF